MKYYQILNIKTLEVFVSQDLEEAPINSIPFFENDFMKPIFDKYPNPLEVVEGITKEEIDEFNAKFNNELDIKYTKLISDLVDKHVQKLATRQIPIPKEILEEQQRLINEYKQLIK